MKKALKIFIIVFLLFIYIYICKIDSIPSNIIIYKKDNINFEKFFGISYTIENKKVDTILASSNFEDELQKENILQVKLFDKIPIKDITVNIIEQATVIPGGQISGLKLYTNGVMVVGKSEIKSEDGKYYKPYENSNIQEGDRITKINDEEVQNTKNLIDIVNKSNGEKLKIEFIKSNEVKLTEIVPVKAQDKNYKIGLWVRDSNAGIGTLSFYEPSTGNFAALGHGITDIDTGDLVEIADGEFLTTHFAIFSANSGFFINMQPLKVFTTFGTGHPMFMSIISGFDSRTFGKAYSKYFGWLPKS